MPQHKSAEKRVRQNAKRKDRNRFQKSRMRSMIKNLMNTTDKEEASLLLNQAKATMHRLATKGIVHENFASRSIGRMERYVNSLG